MEIILVNDGSSESDTTLALTYVAHSPEKIIYRTHAGCASSELYLPPQLVPLLYPFGTGQPPCPSGIMIRKEAAARNGNFEESFVNEFQLYEDQAFLFKIYCNEIVDISDEVRNW